MSISSLLLTLTPIAVIIWMLVVWKKPADISGIVGWITVSVIAFLFFHTSIEVIIRSTLAGGVKSFTVSTYTMKTANFLNIGLTGMLIITAGLAFGGGLASVISPAKLQNAAAAIDKLGEETKVIRIAFVFALLLTTVTAALVVLLLKIYAV